MADGTEPPAHSDLDRRIDTAEKLLTLTLTLDAIERRTAAGEDTDLLRRWVLEMQDTVGRLHRLRDEETNADDFLITAIRLRNEAPHWRSE
jgi:hypothetical protein